MDTKTFADWYQVLICLAFVISALNWLGYTILARWYKSAWGRLIWAKFLANMLVLSVPFMSIVLRDFPGRRLLMLLTMGLFIVVISFVGFYIYTTQIQGYIKKRLTKKGNKEDANVA